MASSITAKDLSTLAERIGPEVRVLSLDCFDTLVWRNTHAPADVFADLPSLSPPQRMVAERAARQRAAANGRDEVNFHEIYGSVHPEALKADLGPLIEAELAAEARHCFGFRPTVELIRKAKARGLKVIVVSDTYLDKAQLRALIAAAAGQDVADAIDAVFCSSQYGMSKSGGLFKHVLRELKLPPQSILHLGDNQRADQSAPAALGVQAIHFRQFDEATEQRLRLEAAASVLLHAAGPRGRAVLQPHRAQLALGPTEASDPPAALGYGVLGPVFDAFARWLQAEARDLARERGAPVKMLFLMRDGRLPRLAYQAVAGAADPRGQEIEISRFTAGAISLTSEEAILRHLDSMLGMPPEMLLRQCLFTSAEAQDLIAKTDARQSPLRLGEEVRKPRVLGKIAARSRAFRQRLVDYLRNEVQPEPGDTVILVDLGYNATVQNRIDRVLREELGVHVAGRYLLLNEDMPAGLDKRGLIDDRHYDPAALASLCENISVVEQLSTCAWGSVIDYDETGPVRDEAGLKARQSAVREQVQAACLRYIAEAGQGMVRPPDSATPDAARQSAAAALGRLLFLPSEGELEALKSFEHDVNSGSDEQVKLFDPEVGRAGLRQWGMLYMKGARRMFLAAELRGQGLPASLSLMTQSRFGLDLRYRDYCDTAIRLPIMIGRDQQIAEETIEAQPTHEGYFVAGIPIGDCRLNVAVLFGQLYEWVQIESIGFLPLKEFFGVKREGEFALSPAASNFQGMTAMAGGLMRCESRDGFMLVPPPPRVNDQPMVLAVVFRPIEAWREAEAAAQTAA